jgi:hypothetical protein
VSVTESHFNPAEQAFQHYNAPTNMGLNFGQFILIVLACLWILSASLAPDVIFFGPFNVRLEDLLTILLAGLLLCHVLLKGLIGKEALGFLARLFLTFFGLGLLGYVAIMVVFASGSNLPDTGTFGYSLILEVLKEYVRFGKYIVVAFAFVMIPGKAWRPVVATLGFCCTIIVVIQILQYCDVTTVRDWVDTTYNAGLVAELTGPGARTAGYWKSGSVMIQPNVLGAFLVLPQLLFLMLFFRSIKSLSCGKCLLHLLVSGIIFIGIFMAQSITALLSVMAGAAVGVFHLGKRSRPNLLRLAVCALAVLTAIYLAFWFSGGMTKFTEAGFKRGFGEGSLDKKITNTQIGVKELGSKIIIGAGPANAIMTDNEIGYILTWYGLIGLFIYYLFYWSLFRLIIREIRDVYIRSAFIGVLVSYMVGAVGSSFLINNRVFPVFIALLTIALSQGRESQRMKTISDSSSLATGKDFVYQR